MLSVKEVYNQSNALFDLAESNPERQQFMERLYENVAVMLQDNGVTVDEAESILTANDMWSALADVINERDQKLIFFAACQEALNSRN